MNKNKFMRERIAPLFTPLGFTMKRDGKFGVTTWVFEKYETDLVLRILFTDDGDITVEFRSNVFGRDLLLDKELQERGHSTKRWKYENDQEWLDCMEDIEQALIQYGQELIEKVSTPSNKPMARVEAYRQIQGNYPELINAAENRWPLAGRGYQEQFEILFQAIEQEKGKDFLEAEPTLVMIAAYIGKIWSDNFGGEWIWNDSFKTYYIEGKSIYLYVVNSLVDVIHVWMRDRKMIVERYARYIGRMQGRNYS